MTSAEIFADNEPEADYLFNINYSNTTLNPTNSTDVPFTAVVRRRCPVGDHQIVTDLAGLRAHMYSKHRVVVQPTRRPRAFAWT